jgi:hypothetical protein
MATYGGPAPFQSLAQVAVAAKRLQKNKKLI